jgi:hypothetical protein
MAIWPAASASAHRKKPTCTAAVEFVTLPLLVPFKTRV